MAEYDATQHSKDRLGICGHCPVVPVMPTGAQVSAQTGMMHLRLAGSEGYVRAPLPSFAPVSYAGVVKAIRSQPTEPSYSGTGSQYFVLAVDPQPDGLSAKLWAGKGQHAGPGESMGVLVGRVAVFPEAEIVSADTPLEKQLEEGQQGL